VISRYFQPQRPRLYAHRGAAGTCPENTMAAFRAAVEAGSRYLELDVWASRDGVVMIHHDETMLRTCNDPRRLSDLDLAELKQLDAGATFSSDGGLSIPFRNQGIGIPTLAELLREIPDIFFNIEIKQAQPPIEELVLAAVREAGAQEQVLLAAEHDEIMQRLRPLAGAIPTSLSFGELTAFFTWLLAGCPAGYQPPGAALQIPETYQGMRLVTEQSLAAAHAVGLEMHVWTVNEPADMRRLLELGVDGVMSDFPEVLLRVAGELDF
jgi:glycerophosphoryl diester phosphodiesterase